MFTKPKKGVGQITKRLIKSLKLEGVVDVFYSSQWNADLGCILLLFLTIPMVPCSLLRFGVSAVPLQLPFLHLLHLRVDRLTVVVHDDDAVKVSEPSLVLFTVKQRI